MDKLKPYISHLNKGITLLTKWHPDTVGHRFKEIARDAGLGHISTHKMRHTFATLLLKAGVDIATVSKLMGHASVEIPIKYYGHIVDGLKTQAMQKLNDILK